MTTPIIDLGSAAINLADVTTSIAANVTYLLQAWGLL
ncbi:hypothetical protein DFR68_103807 [Nocardia mexicana]|uniref:Uncharacterized protein n=1 Tax=Nocardia mexicana TaxID=279262 RepID=A0A370H9R3_9NOCA|nr:hypothetical protein DFR68_103807 [Nocardia mexicana]